MEAIGGRSKPNITHLVPNQKPISIKPLLVAKAKTQFRVSSVISKLKLTETLPLPNNFFKHISHHTLAQIFSLILIFHIPISLFHQSQSMCLFPTHYVFPMLPPLLLHSSFLLFNSHHSPTIVHLSLPIDITLKRK